MRLRLPIPFPGPRTLLRAASAAAALAAPPSMAMTSETASVADASTAAELTDREVVVTASRVPEPAADSLMPVLVIDHEAIEQSLATDIAELLRFHAGIDVARAGGPGQQTSVFIRGANSNHTLVLVDGVRINPGTLGTPAIQNIAPELIDHIEVVKGPLSTLYGADAIGGVINVITRHDGPSRVDALVGYGRYDTREAAASGHYQGTDGSLTLAGHYLDSSGFPTVVGDDHDRGFRDASFNADARTTLGGVELGARAWHAGGTTQYSDYALTPVDQNFRNDAWAVDARGALGGAWRTHLTLSRVTDDIRQVQPDPYAYPPGNDYATTNRDSIDWQNDVDAGAQQLTFGGLLAREHANTLSYGTAFDVRTYADSWYAQDRLTFGAQRLQAAVGWTHHNVYGDHATWNAEYGIAPAPGTLLTAGWGTAFRAPNTTDLYGFAGNPALRPEASRNLELGARQRVSDHEEVSLSLFDNRIDDLIAYVTLPAPVYGMEQNVARARIRGVELAWEWHRDGWRARLEGSHQNPEDRVAGTTLLRRAKDSASLSLAREFGRGELSADLATRGARLDTNYPNDVRLGGYTLLNLAARFTLGAGLVLQARLENALDKQYQTAYGYNTLRRSLMLTLRYASR